MKACLHTVYDVPNEVMNVAAPKTDLSNGKDKRARIVYHEAGHATVAEVLDPGTVTLISAYSSEGQSSGFTSYYRSNARHSTETRYAHICGSLGGIAALEQKYGIVDVGSSNDLDHAFGSVWDLVTENCVCGFSLHSNGFDDSSELRSKQEQAVSSELERWYRKTKEILSVNHDLFESIASELSEKGILTAADIGRIKHSCRVIPVVI